MSKLINKQKLKGQTYLLVFVFFVFVVLNCESNNRQSSQPDDGLESKEIEVNPKQGNMDPLYETYYQQSEMASLSIDYEVILQEGDPFYKKIRINDEDQKLLVTTKHIEGGERCRLDIKIFGPEGELLKNNDFQGAEPGWTYTTTYESLMTGSDYLLVLIPECMMKLSIRMRAKDKS